MGKLSDSTHRIDCVIDNLFHKYGYDHKILEGKVFAAWGGAVGELIAHNTRPVSLISGKLTVYTSNAVWVTELLMLREHVIRKINDAVGQPVVKSLQLSVRPFQPTQQKIQLRRRPNRLKTLESVELAPEILERIERTVSNVADPELKACLKRLFIRQRQRALIDD